MFSPVNTAQGSEHNLSFLNPFTVLAFVFLGTRDPHGHGQTLRRNHLRVTFVDPDFHRPLEVASAQPSELPSFKCAEKRDYAIEKDLTIDQGESITVL